MGLKMFKNKQEPRLGDLVRPRMVSGITGIVVSVKECEDDKSSKFYEESPRKIFIIKWVNTPAISWPKAKVKTEYFAHQLEVISKA